MSDAKITGKRTRWRRICGLNRRPIAGDVLMSNTAPDVAKRLVWHVGEHWVRVVPFDCERTTFVESSINVHALHHYFWLENRRGIGPGRYAERKESGESHQRPASSRVVEVMECEASR